MARYVGLSRRALAAVGVVGLFFVAVGLAFSFGVVDVPGSGGPGGAGGANESTAGVDARTAPAGRVGQYDFDVVRVRTCGFACRNVTTRLTNVGNDTAQDVTVRTRIYTGDELLWQDRERVGYLPPNQTYRDTVTVELSYVEAGTVKTHGGNITIVTTISSAEAEYTFAQHRDVTD